MLRLHPDLVLAARFGAQATVAALTALGLRALHVELPDAVHCPRGVDFGAVSESTGRTIHVLTCYSAAMNVLRRPTMTLEQFLDWEERQEAKYEFNGFEPVLMSGGTEEQAEIQTNILAALRSRLRGHRCRVLGSDLKVKVMGRIRYPDAFVVCSPRERGRTVVTDPVIVFEIISESTQHTDLVEKNDEYRETPSIQRYIILEQTHVGGIAFVRSEDGRWTSSTLNGPEAVVGLPEIGISLPLGEFYAGMSLTAVDTDPSEPA